MARRVFTIDNGALRQLRIEAEDLTHTDSGPIWDISRLTATAPWEHDSKRALGRAWDSGHSGWYATPYQYKPWDSMQAPHRSGFGSLREAAIWLLGVFDAKEMERCMKEIESDRIARDHTGALSRLAARGNGEVST